MLKMLKYEWRKNILSLLIVLGVYAALQIYFLIATYGTKSYGNTAIAGTLLMLVAMFSYVFVLLYGIISYNADLKNKSGYLVFMAPVSSFKILGAKLLSTLITGIAIVAVIVGLAFWDFSIVRDVFNVDAYISFGNELLGALGSSLSIWDITIRIIFIIFSSLISFYMTVTVGYLSVSISATLLQNKKGKGFLSVLLFIIILAVVLVIEYFMPDTKITAGMSFAELCLNDLPSLLLELFVTIAAFIGSGIMLDKKISL